jgi:phenylalanyl-tRNA synthetase beta subunit
VKASLEEIYGTLIDDKFFISLNNGFAKIIDTVGKFADSIGGVKGVLLLLGNIATKIFGTEISNGINNMIQNIRNASGVAQQESSKLREKARDIALSMTKDMSSHEIDALRQSVSTTYEAQEKLLAQSKTMSKGQLEVAQNALRVA